MRPYKSLFVLLFYNGRTDRASLQDDVGGMGMDAETTTVGTLGLSVRCRTILTTLAETEPCRDARVCLAGGRPLSNDRDFVAWTL